MPTWDNAFSGRPVVLRLNVDLYGQDIANNYSGINWSLQVVEAQDVTAWSNNPANWAVQINGQSWSGTFTYDFRNESIRTIASGTHGFYHNADGTKTLGAAAQASDPSGYLGSSSGLSVQIGIPTIARASNSTFGPVDAGSPLTINTNRASSGFTHTLTYDFGTARGDIATGVTDSFVWTPPMSLLNQIPNATSGTGIITTITYSGGTQIGMTNRALVINAGGGVVPDFSSINYSEATAGLTANIGGYVQNLTRLNMSIDGAAGTYGSSITSYRLEVNGQVVNAASGTTGGVITASGAQTITGTITDSRGRTKTKTTTVNLLPYSPPTIYSAIARRAVNSGALNDNGTYIRIDLNALTQSLVVGSERNKLRIVVYTKVYGQSNWAVVLDSTQAGTSYNSYFTVGNGGYGITTAYDVYVEVSDDFSASGVQITVPTAAIFMHWNSGVGVGIGKYHQQGSLDVWGPIYQNNGNAVLDAATSLNADNVNGRLGIAGKTLPQGDWDYAGANGWYMGSNYANAPIAGDIWFYVSVMTHNNDWILQTAYAFGGGFSDRVFRRRRAGSTVFGPWVEIFDNVREAGGSFSIPAIGAGGLHSMTITFPAGRFNLTPLMFLQSAEARHTTGINAMSLSSATIVIFNDTGAATNAIWGQWNAKQMTNTTQGG